MNAGDLLAHYEAVADAPDAIAQLRRFILDLAVRGKLVPQDTSDEPASELLQRIAKEKARLVRAGEIRKPKELSPLDDRKLPFSVPTGWAVASLDDLGPRSLSDGDWIETKDQSEDGGVRLIQLADVGVGEFLNKSARYVTEETEVRLNCTRLAVGDVLIARLPNPIGRACIFPNIGQPAITAVDVAILRTDYNISAEFVVLAMNADPVREQIEAYGKGATRFRVSTGHLKTVQIPLPPLAEQSRIVAKVDELMGLCDRLEAARAGREALRDRLSVASLARLGAPDPETFQGDARFALEALPALTTRPDQIKALRQTILNLAVRGKLVPQDPADEPASSWLLRALGNEAPGRGRNAKAVSAEPSKVVTPDHTLPGSWHWTELGRLVTVMDAGWSPQCENHPRSDPKKWGVLKTTAVQTLAFDCKQHKELPAKFEPRPQHEAVVGDILVTRAGPKNRVGISCVVDQIEPRLMISDKLIRFRLLRGLSPRFFALALNAGITSIAIEDAKSGMAVMQMNISQDKLRAVPVPLPPLAEQHRIVAKVDALMARCDQLEASLTASAATRRRLLDALLAEALAPAAALEMQAAE